MLLKNIVKIGLLTLVSRVFGYIRDVLIAAKLGAGVYSDIFIIILRLPNLFRSIFGEGALNASFVPIYSAILETKGKKYVDKFAASVHFMLIIALLSFILILMFFMPEFVEIITPGYSSSHSEYMPLIISLSKITLPYLFFISLVAFYGGILNSQGKYFAFAFVPVLLNLSLILGIILGVILSEDKLIALERLAYGILFGGIIEFLWMLGFLWYYKGLVGLSPKITSELKLLFSRFFPALLGSGVAQINVLVDTVVASFIVGGMSYIYFADRVNQLALAIIGTSAGTVMLPMLAKAFKSSNLEAAFSLQNKTINWLAMISLPASFGVIAIANPLIELLFQRGRFDENAHQIVSTTLMAMSWGLPALVINKVIVVTFHAQGDTKTPVKIASICIFINALIGFSCLDYLGHLGIVLASVISAWFNLLSLGYIANKRGWLRIDRLFIRKLFYYILSSMFMVFVLLQLPNLNNALLSLIIKVGVGAACYFVSLLLLLMTKNA